MPRPLPAKRRGMTSVAVLVAIVEDVQGGGLQWWLLAPESYDRLACGVLVAPVHNNEGRQKLSEASQGSHSAGARRRGVASNVGLEDHFDLFCVGQGVVPNGDQSGAALSQLLQAPVQASEGGHGALR